MLSSSEINALGQVLNSTWGNSQMSDFRTPTMSIRTSLSGDVLTCSYTTICNFASERNLRDQVSSVESDSVKLIKDYIKEVKKRFKEISGRTLKTKELNTRDSVELITTSPYTPRKTGYYRRFTDFQVE
tara:strand:- start:71 stop:457 length:387 start_codon:yes stop_codon:yes gene_type:complete